MGLQAVGLMVLGIFSANDSMTMTSIDTRSKDGRIYVGDHKTYIYKLWVSPFQRKRFLFFSHNKSIHIPVSPKTTCNLSPSIPDDAFICNLTKISPLIFFFENMNGRCHDEHWTIGTLKLEMSFRGHVS